jgi:hypothetical protein
MSRAIRALLVSAALAPLAVPGSANARDLVLSTDRSAANIAAFGQGLAWSRDAGTQSRLVLRAFGPAYDVALPPAGGLFDPDLGSDGRGGLIAVYTRCAGVSGRNCDVYQYDLIARLESKVSGASTPGCSEFAPSVWEGAIAFGRSGPRECDGLYVKGRRGSALRLEKRIPADTDFREGRVAYLHAPSANRTAIRLFTIRQGHSRLVAAGRRTQTRVSNPAFSGRYLNFLFEDRRRDEFLVGRSRGTGTTQFSSRSLPGSVDSIALDGRSLFYANGRGVFHATDPLLRYRTGG